MPRYAAVLLCSALLAAAPVPVAGRPTPDPGGADRKRMQGAWVLTAEGRRLDQFTLVMAGNRLTLYLEDSVLDRGSFSVAPGSYEVRWDGPLCRNRNSLASRGTSRLEGDTLTLNDTGPGKGWPA